MQTPLRMILAITGCVIVWLGLNVGLGGIQTLGWQGSADFMDVTDEPIYAIRDNHVRFIAGVWSAVGLLMIAGAFWITQMRGLLLSLFAMIFVGGLMRLSAADSGLLLSADIAPSLIAELVLFPLLALWIYRSVANAQ